jgi:ubiquitin C-terminal hydrolase
MDNKDYPMLQSIIKHGFQFVEETAKTWLTLMLEVKAIRKKMTCLPTSREMEAEPELKFVKEVSFLMNQPEFAATEELILGNEKLERLIMEELLAGTCADFLKTRIYTNKVLILIADDMMHNLVVFCSRRLDQARQSVYGLLNVIIDKQQEFYKNNGKETNLFAWAFGTSNELDGQLKKWIDTLQKGEPIDVLKTFGGKQNWTRGTFDSKEPSFCKIKYWGESALSYMMNHYLEIRPFKSMSTDFEWREGLKEGDLVDFHSFRSGWILARVAAVIITENYDGDKVRQIELKKEVPSGDDKPANSVPQTTAGYINVGYYDEFSSPVKQHIHSSLVARPFTCSLRSSSQIDDSADANFELPDNDPRVAVLRPNTNSGVSSVYFVKYTNLFAECHGFRFIEHAIANQRQLNNDLFNEAVYLLKNTAECLLKSYLDKKGRGFIEALLSFHSECIERNIRLYSQHYLSNFIDAVSVLYLRVLKSNEASNAILDLVIRSGIVCLKSEILEKQFFGAKLVLSYEGQLREAHNKRFQDQLVTELLSDNLLEKLLKGHPSLIAKSSGIIKCLFAGDYLQENHIDVMWNLVVKADSESRAALVSLIKELTSEMSRDHIRLFCKRILENPGELTVEVLELIELFKRVSASRFDDKVVAGLVSSILWKSLQSERDIRKEVAKELTKVFVRYVKNDQLDNYLPKIIDGIASNANRMRNLKLLISFLKESSVSTYSLGQTIRDSKLFDQVVADLCDKVRLLAQRSLKQGVPSTTSLPQLTSSKPGDSSSLSSSELQSGIRKALKLMRLVLFSKYMAVDEELFHFGHFEMIYEEMFRSGGLEKCSQEWLIEYLRQSHSDSLTDKFAHFFTQRLAQTDEFGKEDFLVFFLAIFRKVNIHQGKLVERLVRFQGGRIDSRRDSKTQLVCESSADSFFGMDLVWELYLRTSNRTLYRKLAQLIAKVYLPPEFIDSTNRVLYSQQRDRLAAVAVELMSHQKPIDCQKASLLLIDIIRKDLNKREAFGFSVAQLREVEKVQFNVEKDSKYIRDRFKVKMSGNATVQELKEKVAEHYKAVVGRVSLAKADGKSISDLDNFQTLDNMAICDHDLVLYHETNVPECADVELMNPSRTEFSDHLKVVWREVFEEFSEGELMTKHHFERLTAKATNTPLTHNSHMDERIREIFAKYGVNEGQHLRFEGLLAFYTDSVTDSFEKSRIVRDNLRELGYDKDFVLKQHRVERTETNSFRVQLANNAVFMKHLFDIVSTHRPDDPVTPDPQPEAHDDSDLSFVVRLFSLLPIPPAEVTRLFNDPTAYFAEPSKPFIWNYKATLLHALLFRKDFVDSLALQDVSESSFSSAVLVERVASREFFDVVLSWMARAVVGDSFRSSHSMLQMTISTLDKITHTLVAIKDEQFAQFHSEFFTFFSKRKPKRTDAPPSDTPTANPAPASKHRPSVDHHSMLSHTLAQCSLTDALLSCLDFPSLNNTLLLIALNAAKAKPPATTALKALLKTSILTLISSIFLARNDFRDSVGSEQFRELMLEGLTHDFVLFKVSFNNLCLAVAHLFDDVKVKIELLKLLIANIRLKKGEESSSLVELACAILAEIGEMKAGDAGVADIIHEEFNFTSLFMQFKEEFLGHKSKESTASQSEDTQMMSLLAFLERIVIADEVVLAQVDHQAKMDLVHHLFSDCLFRIEGKSIEFGNVKCHSQKSRQHAFGLLVQLLKGSTRLNIHFMVREVSPLVRHVPSLVWASSAHNDGRSAPNAYLGIQNLGCICYMIATLQQFYCIPAFRYAILMADDNLEQKTAEVKGVQIDDNYFHQFQRLLSFLDASERRKVSPFDFCLSYKDFSNQPVNISIQQDADEFLKIFLDKMENKLKGTPFLGVINSVCLGHLCNRIKCQGCGHVKLNTENFYNLSLEVKGMRNITDSLDKLIEPEIISDYMCDSCKKKCDISKQVLLQSLPNMLFLSLKKMYFDIELLVNVKLHSRYEFPTVINLRKYMHVPEEPKGEAGGEGGDGGKGGDGGDGGKGGEGGDGGAHQKVAEDSDFEYQLRGVVIHKGNAEYGHYTSLIKGDPKDPARQSEDLDRWFEFDDARVVPFDMRKFEEECFGPAEDKDVMTLLATENDSSKSAYLLVFEKTVKGDLVFEFSDQNTHLKDFILDNLSDRMAHNVDGNRLTTGFHNLKQFIPKVYLEEVVNDNKVLMLEQNLLSRTFTKSMADIFHNVDLAFDSSLPADDPSNALTDKRAYAETVLKNLPQLLSKVYCVSSENESIHQVVIAIERALVFFHNYAQVRPDHRPSIDTKLTNFFVEQITKPFGNIQSAILNSSDQNVQSGLIEYVSRVASVVIRYFGIVSLEDVDKDDDSPVERLRNALSQVLLTVVFSMTHSDDSAVLFRKYGLMFALAYMLAKDHLPIMRFLANRNVFQSLLNVYLKFDNSKMHAGERTASWLLKLVLLLYSYMANYAKDTPAYLDKLSSLNKLEVLIKASKEDYRFEDYESLKHAAFMFCYNDKRVSEAVAFSMLKAAAMVMSSDFGGCLEVLRVLLCLNDPLQDYRIRVVLGVPRLSENCSLCFYDEKRYLYGLARESSLRKPVLSYLSPFGLEKGLLELVISNRDYYETQTMVFLQFLLSAMLSCDRVLDYVVRLHPPNYISATFYDWFYSYALHHDKKEVNEYNSFKFENSKKTIQDVLHKVRLLESRLTHRFSPMLVGHTPKRLFSFVENPYQSYYSFYTADRPDVPTDLLWSIKPVHVIGKTLGFELLQRVVLCENGSGQLKVKFWLIKLAMLDSLPDGRTNYTFPDSMIFTDLTLRMTNSPQSKLQSFFSPLVRSESDEPAEIHGIFEESEESNDRPVKQPGTQRKNQGKRMFELPDNPSFINSKHLVRISVTNTTNESYFLKLWVCGSNGRNFDNCEITAPVQGRKHDHLIHTVMLEDVEESFDGLNVQMAFKTMDYCNMKYFDEQGFKQASEQFRFKK